MMKLLASTKLEQYFKELGILRSVQSLVQWDNDVMMPRGGAKLRAEQLMYLSSENYRRLNNPILEDWIFKAESESLDDWQQANLTLIKRQYQQNKILDESFVKALTNACLACELNWREAKKNNDFNQFAKYFKEVLKLTQESSQRLSDLSGLTPYDALLDTYDYGRRSAEIDLIFNDLEKFLPGFIMKVQDKQKSHNIIQFTDEFSIEKQKALANICMEKLGFDLEHGRLDISAHPFSVGFSPDDVRITTRYKPEEFLSGLYGILHETGHALYEQNLPQKHPFQPVSSSCGMTIHESQSLFVERQIGASYEFCQWIAPYAIKEFGSSQALAADNLYNIVTKVEASLIRVEADEVTYPAHVIMRYKLEKALLSGDLPIDELPLAWSDESYKLLQIRPQNHSEGCLQDIHWSWGNIGYFPTYTLGAMLASQIENAMNKTLDKNSLIKAGNFKPIIKWLNENIHSLGSRYTSNELIDNATGSKLDANIFQQYLTQKYL